MTQDNTLTVTSNTSVYDIQEALESGKVISDLSQIKLAIQISKKERDELNAQYHSSPDYYEDPYWYDYYVFPIESLIWKLEELQEEATVDDDSEEMED